MASVVCEYACWRSTRWCYTLRALDRRDLRFKSEISVLDWTLNSKTVCIAHLFPSFFYSGTTHLSGASTILALWVNQSLLAWRGYITFVRRMLIDSQKTFECVHHASSCIYLTERDGVTTKASVVSSNIWITARAILLINLNARPFVTRNHSLDVTCTTFVVARIEVRMTGGTACCINTCWLQLMSRLIVDCEPSLISIHEGVAVNFAVLHILLREGATFGN